LKLFLAKGILRALRTGTGWQQHRMGFRLAGWLGAEKQLKAFNQCFPAPGRLSGAGLKASGKGITGIVP
jgi:hypothetical protein